MKASITTKLLFAGLLAGILATGIVSCKKYNDWETDESTNRLFRPTSVAAVVDGVTITLRWKPKPGTSTYTIEISKDSLQFAQIVKTYNASTLTADKDGLYNYTFPDLQDPLTRYSARIKGVDSTGGTPESEWVAVTYKTTTEQLMEPVTDGDKTPYTVTLKWKVSNQVSHFMLLNAQGAGTKYDITDAEKAAGAKTIAGLTPKSSFTAILYYNTTIRGQQAFALPADLPKGPNVVQLTATDNLAAMIAAQTKPDVMYVLLQGSKYTTVDPINIPDGISFTIWGEAGANRPVLAFNGINLPLTAGTIKFENLDITGYNNNNPADTKRDYIFNQATATTTNEIIFENCIIRNLVNSPMRIKSTDPVTIGKFTVNNCLVYDIGDNGANGAYSFINNNVATARINNITLTNSTFTRIGYGLILHNVSPSVTVTVSDNTFYNVTGNGRLFIDYNAQTISGGFIFRNNIYAKTYSPLNTAKGIRSTTTPPVVTNSYKASDVNFSAGNPITGILDYTQTGTDLFTDPANNNFLIKDNSFAGKSTSGDPRWRN